MTIRGLFYLLDKISLLIQIIWPVMMRLNAFVFLLRNRRFLKNVKVQSEQVLFRKAICVVLRVTRCLDFSSHVVNLINKLLMLREVSLHVLFRLLLEKIKFLFWNILPNSANFLHNIESRNIGVLFDYFWSSLKDILKRITYCSNKKHVRS